MALYSITHTCGHESKQQMYGAVSERGRKADWFAGQPCMDCKRAAETAAVTAHAVAQSLPALTGSDKQIAWAQTIRQTILAAIDAKVTVAGQGVAKSLDLGQITETEAQDILSAVTGYRAAIAAETESRYWIDNRDNRGVAGGVDNLLRQKAQELAAAKGLIK